VPTDYGFGRDDDESLFPLRPELTSSDPEKPVEQIEPWPRMPTLQNCELLPEREVFQEKIPTVTKDANKCSEAEEKQVEHGTELYQSRAENIVVSY